MEWSNLYYVGIGFILGAIVTEYLCIRRLRVIRKRIEELVQLLDEYDQASDGKEAAWKDGKEDVS